MVKPDIKIAELGGSPKQLKLDFGDRFRDIANKMADKAVVQIMTGCAMLGLDEIATNEVMEVVRQHNNIVEAHTEK